MAAATAMPIHQPLLDMAGSAAAAIINVERPVRKRAGRRAGGRGQARGWRARARDGANGYYQRRSLPRVASVV